MAQLINHVEVDVAHHSIHTNMHVNSADCILKSVSWTSPHIFICLTLPQYCSIGLLCIFLYVKCNAMKLKTTKMMFFNGKNRYVAKMTHQPFWHMLLIEKRRTDQVFKFLWVLFATRSNLGLKLGHDSEE